MFQFFSKFTGWRVALCACLALGLSACSRPASNGLPTAIPNVVVVAATNTPAPPPQPPQIVPTQLPPQPQPTAIPPAPLPTLASVPPTLVPVPTAPVFLPTAIPSSECCAPNPNPAPPPRSGGGNSGCYTTYYIVRPGDNLFRIALNHGTTAYAIARQNGIPNVRLINPGQRLKISVCR